MNTDYIRTLIIELAAAQLNTTPDKITDATAVPDINSLMLDAACDLGTVGHVQDIQHFSTVGDVIKAFSS